jgi:hypothetical protein
MATVSRWGVEDTLYLLIAFTLYARYFAAGDSLRSATPRKETLMDKERCQYPGCERHVSMRCGMIGCTHKVCDIHGNGGYDDCVDEPPVEICWGCAGMGWGDMPVALLPGIHRLGR